MPEFLTIAEIASLIRMNVDHVRDRITHRPDFPTPIVIGQKKLYKRDEIMEWLESRRVAA